MEYSSYGLIIAGAMGIVAAGLVPLCVEKLVEEESPELKVLLPTPPNLTLSPPCMSPFTALLLCQTCLATFCSLINHVVVFTNFLNLLFTPGVDIRHAALVFPGGHFTGTSLQDHPQMHSNTSTPVIKVHAHTIAPTVSM